MRQTSFYLVLGLIYTLSFNWIVVSAQDNTDRIQPYGENSYYWQYKGEPVLLLGGSRDDNLFQLPELKEHLEQITEAGGNYIRNTMSDRPDKGHELYPFSRLDNGRYDLEQWNQAYWQRFENMLRWASERDIIVQIEIWDRFDYSRDNWEPHPYNPKNNVNYSYEESGFQPEYPNHPGANEQPFFFTTPRQQNNTTVLSYQQRFVDKLLDHALKYPNILYCMDNETSGEEAWSVYWAEYIRKRAKKNELQVNLTEMWNERNLKKDIHLRSLDHPERFDFVEVSQNNHLRNETHWDNIFWIRNYLSDQPRPMNNVKIYAADGETHGGDSIDAVEKFWRLIFSGAASARFHRPYHGLGLNELAKAQLRSAGLFLDRFDIFQAEPDATHELLSGRQEDEAYLTRIDGQQYAVFFTDGGGVRLNLPDVVGSYELEWLDIANSQWSHTQSVSQQENIRLNAPGDGQWVVIVSRK